MTTTTTRRPAPATRQAATRRLRVLTRLVTGLVGVLAIVLGVVLVIAMGSGGGDDGGAADLPLPNPMGGPALHAPAPSGPAVTVGGLEVVASEVAMGDVPLDVTMVSSWTLTNPTTDPVTLVIGQPQVHEGCCPGPVYVDEQLVVPGGTVTVPAGGEALVQFPLQMHEGMDGPHHLTIPLTVDGDVTELHVTGNFTADV